MLINSRYLIRIKNFLDRSLQQNPSENVAIDQSLNS